MIDGRMTLSEREGRTLEDLIEEWKAGPRPGEPGRESLERLSEVRCEMFMRMRCPGSISGKTPKGKG